LEEKAKAKANWGSKLQEFYKLEQGN